MNLLQEYKELYNHEMVFCDRLNAKISNALAIITIVGTGEAIVWKDCLGDNFNILFFILCLLSLQCFIITLYRFYLAYSKYTYGYYPIDKTKEYVDDVIKKLESKGKDEKYINERVNKLLENTYINSAIINRNQNLLKSMAHRKLNKWIIVSVISVFLCYACDIITNSDILKTLI